MNQTRNENLEKRYMKEIKALFPIVSKKEKAYLLKMADNISETLSDENVSKPESIEDFYTLFGEPYDIVHQYFSEMNADTFHNVLSLKIFRKRIWTVITALIFTAVFVFCFVLWQEYQSYLRSEVTFITTEIEILESEDE